MKVEEESSSRRLAQLRAKSTPDIPLTGTEVAEHEYAHAVFDKNMERYSDLWRRANLEKRNIATAVKAAGEKELTKETAVNNTKRIDAIIDLQKAARAPAPERYSDDEIRRQLNKELSRQENQQAILDKIKRENSLLTPQEAKEFESQFVYVHGVSGTFLVISFQS